MFAQVIRGWGADTVGKTVYSNPRLCKCSSETYVVSAMIEDILVRRTAFYRVEGRNWGLAFYPYLE